MTEHRPERRRLDRAGERYLVCTGPFGLRRTVFYTVVDLVEQVRGTKNLAIGGGAETREDCEEMLARLEWRDPHPTFERTEVSHRNRIPLRVEALETTRRRA